MILRRNTRGQVETGYHLLFGGELLVEVVEVKAGRRQVLDARQESGGLELGHRSFELRRNEREWLVLNSKRFVEVDGFGDEVGVKPVKVVVEQRREVLRQIVRFLQTGS